MDIKASQQQVITDTVNDLFFRLKARLLGRFFKGPKIYFEILRQSNPLETLEGVFRFTIHSLYGPGADVDEDQIKQLALIVSNYIEAERLKTVNRVLEDVAHIKSVKDLEETVGKTLARATTYVNGVAESELRNAQAYAEKDGIVQLAAHLGLDDPTVAKLGRIDGKTCKNCIKLWHLEENPSIPRVYKLSELQDGYMRDQKDPKATVGHTHPNCRHVLTFVPPNFSFHDTGSIYFKSMGWDEYAHQRSAEKAEILADVFETLRKAQENHADCCADPGKRSA